MDLIYLTIIAILLLILIIAGVNFKSQVRIRRRWVSDEYTEGLKLILLGQKKQALEKLRLAALKDTSNLDAYLKIGEILRENGKIENAIKIHRQLIVRKDLSNQELIQIYKNLINDFWVAKKYEQGLNYVEKLLQMNKKNTWALDNKLKFYEALGQWQKAFETKQHILKLEREKNDPLLALYKFQKGLALISEAKEKEGRIAYREALKLDETCVPAYLYLSDSYVREDRKKDALNQLMTLIEKVPEKAHLTFDRLRQLLFDMGSFSQLETIYQTLQAKNPENNEAYLALAKLYERKGNFNEALELSLQSYEKNPDSMPAMERIIRYYYKLGEKDKAVKYALSWFEKLNAGKTNFICSQCGYESSEPLWYCPNCKSWDTFVK